MFDKFQSRLNLKGEVQTLTAIRIGAGRSTSPVGADLPVVRDAANRPYIPGSSFKGVLRSYIESILRSFTAESRIVCNPTNDKEQCITAKKMEEDFRDKRDDALILKNTCWVCQLFGSLWYASKLQIRDLHVNTDLWFGQYQQRDGVAIDRDTQTVAGRQLYDFEVVPAGVVFNFQAIVDNAEDWQLGMLYIGLSAFEKGEVTIGGGSSRGLGAIKLSLKLASYIDSSTLMKHLTQDHKGKEVDWQPWIDAFQGKIKNQLEDS